MARGGHRIGGQRSRARVPATPRRVLPRLRARRRRTAERCRSDRPPSRRRQHGAAG